jgi:predicted nucleic acid-binding protein
VRDVLLLPVIGYTKSDARLSAEVELRAEGTGRAIRRTDSMIAAMTMNHGASLYTFDLKHFQPIADMGLRLFAAND